MNFRDPRGDRTRDWGVHPAVGVRPGALAFFLLGAALLAIALSGLGQASPKKAQGGAGGHDACGRCHVSHRTASPKLSNRSGTSELCARCHEQPEPASRTAPATDSPIQIPPWNGTGSSHLEAFQVERGQRPYVRVAEGGGRRVVLRSNCDGCHDPHVKEPSKLRQVSFDSRGDLTAAKPAFVAQVCFGCHAGQEAARLHGVAEGQQDIGLHFGTGAASSHAIGRTAKDRPDLPSLNGTSFQGRLDCVSCHDSPEGSTARGPHTSPYLYLLKASYGTEKDGSAGTNSNDLCYTCHSRMSIEGDQSFPYHRQHVAGFLPGPPRPGPGGIGTEPKESPSFGAIAPTGARGLRSGRHGAFLPGFGEPTPCATCHDPHGSRQNPSLIRFDTSVVLPSSVGGPDYRRTGLGHGTCTLSCHGYDHIQTTY